MTQERRPRRKGQPGPLPDNGTWYRGLAEIARIQQEDPVSPCDGGVIVARSAGWRCVGGTWCIVEWNTWLCPDGTRKTRGRALFDSQVKCP